MPGAVVKSSDPPGVSLSFANNFWGKDDAGVPPLLERMHNAKLCCDELKTFYNIRAAIEEEYARKLLALSRKPLGSRETGSLRASLDTVKAETEALGKTHGAIAAQMKSELEEPLVAFAGGMKERRKIVQTGIEKLLKVKMQQTQAVNKTRDRFEQDCLRVKGYLAQGHMVMGQEERKNKAKLEKTQAQLAQNSHEYENAVKTLEDTSGKWVKEWKVACDKFQDLEEERLDFTRSCLWNYANIASTACVSDDASCEKIRVALEECEVEKDIHTFIKEKGTGHEIPDPPKFVNFSRSDSLDDDEHSDAGSADDPGYSVAQFHRPIHSESSPAADAAKDDKDDPIGPSMSELSTGPGSGSPRKGAPADSAISRRDVRRAGRVPPGRPPGAAGGSRALPPGQTPAPLDIRRPRQMAKYITYEEITNAGDEPFESSYIDSLHHLGPGPSTSDEPEVSSPRLKPTSIRGHAHLQGHHGHRKTDSGRSLYDGSDYGNDSDFEESTDLSPALEQRMASIDNLVRFSLAESRAGGDQVVERMIEGLRDLGGSQGRLETSASRLITAHTAIASHLQHQTRTLQTLTHPLLYSHFPILSTDAIDDLLALIDDLIPTLPFPTPIPSAIEQSQQQSQSPPPPSSSPPLDPTDLPEPPDLSNPEVLASTTTTDPLISLQALLAQTSDITHALRFISDTIHESRQLTSIASRRLRNVRELVADIRREDEGREERTRFIEKGDWDRKLSDREAGKECKDVVSGFEEVCGASVETGREYSRGHDGFATSVIRTAKRIARSHPTKLLNRQAPPSPPLATGPATSSADAEPSTYSKGQPMTIFPHDPISFHSDTPSPNSVPPDSKTTELATTPAPSPSPSAKSSFRSTDNATEETLSPKPSPSPSPASTSAKPVSPTTTPETASTPQKPPIPRPSPVKTPETTRTRTEETSAGKNPSTSTTNDGGILNSLFTYDTTFFKPTSTAEITSKPTGHDQKTTKSPTAKVSPTSSTGGILNSLFTHETTLFKPTSTAEETPKSTSHSQKTTKSPTPEVSPTSITGGLFTHATTFFKPTSRAQATSKSTSYSQKTTKSPTPTSSTGGVLNTPTRVTHTEASTGIESQGTKTASPTSSHDKASTPPLTSLHGTATGTTKTSAPPNPLTSLISILDPFKTTSPGTQSSHSPSNPATSSSAQLTESGTTVDATPTSGQLGKSTGTPGRTSKNTTGRATTGKPTETGTAIATSNSGQTTPNAESKTVTAQKTSAKSQATNSQVPASKTQTGAKSTNAQTSSPTKNFPLTSTRATAKSTKVETSSPKQILPPTSTRATAQSTKVESTK
ncbi:hypothetical protein KEM56_007830, partial [Ascosphaera pollenicola]